MQDDSNTLLESTTLEKGKPGSDEENYSYPQSGNYTYNYWSARDYYRGGSLHMPNGSIFNLTAGALTPPNTIKWGDDVNITLMIDKNDITNELIFTFGPSGAHFSPPAKVFLDYKDLDISKPVLYYIDNAGNYIPQTPDDIDVTNSTIILYISHFSRYAIATE